MKTRTAAACLKSAEADLLADYRREIALASRIGSLTGAIETAHLHLKLGNPIAAQATLARAMEQ